jgi:hypothetical protein
MKEEKVPFRQFKNQQSEFINRQSKWYGLGGGSRRVDRLSLT